MSQNDLFQKPIAPGSEIRQYAPLSQGAEANYKGTQLEKQVVELFVSRGAIIVPFKKHVMQVGDMFHERSLIRQYEYTSCFGVSDRPRRVDIVYSHGGHGPRVGIECKVQDDPGSTDEKLPTLFLESREWEFVDHVWFVLSGDGFRENYVNWLANKAAVVLPTNKAIRVFRSADSLRTPVRLLVENGDATGGQRR